MSVFRPAAKVTSPDGREWEIYAYKIRVGDGGDRSVDEDDLLEPRTGAARGIGPLVDLLLLVPRALFRLAQTVAAAARAVRSDEWTVDAVTYLPRETVYTWTTTDEYKGQVLAQVEGHLARGDVPTRLTNAVYRGERRSAR